MSRKFDKRNYMFMKMSAPHIVAVHACTVPELDSDDTQPFCCDPIPLEHVREVARVGKRHSAAVPARRFQSYAGGRTEFLSSKEWHSRMINARQRALHALGPVNEECQILATPTLDGLFGALDLNFWPARVRCRRQ